MGRGRFPRLFTALLGPLIVVAAAGVAMATEARSPQAVIVRVDADAGDPGAYARRAVAEVGGTLSHVYRHAVRGFAAEVPRSRVDDLERRPGVVEVARDAVTTTQQTPNGVRRIGADAAAAADIDGDGSRTDVDVAVLDSGIDGAHPDLTVAGAVDCTGGSCRTTTATDADWHGTHVAGTIAALDDGRGVVGVAPGARLWSVRVIGADGSGALSDLIAGIDWVRSRADTIEAANASVGCRCRNATLDAALANLTAAGTVVAVAAGNDGQDVADYSPANHPDVLTVSAMGDSDGAPGARGPADCHGMPDDRFTTFSNFGSLVDLAAPGACVRSTVPGGGYGLASGTSMASPHVAGAAALLIATDAIARSPDRAATVRRALRTRWGVAQTHACGFTGGRSPEPMLHLTCAPANTVPTLDLLAPADGSEVAAGTTLALRAAARDAEDGDLTARIRWASNLDGTLGTGGSLTVTLTTGRHTVTATAVDSSGASAARSVGVVVGEPPPPPESIASLPPSPSPTPSPTPDNDAPALDILAPVPDGRAVDDRAVRLVAHAQDPEGGDLGTMIRWTSDRVGTLGQGATIDARLPAGTHAITATVTDRAGVSTSATTTLVVGTAQVDARPIDDACPDGRVPEDGFDDVPTTSPHETAIDCAVWWGLARGIGPDAYGPERPVTRAAMATFLANLIDAAGGTLPDAPANQFDDDEGSVHEASIDRLAAAGIVAGVGDRAYAPTAPVARAQMATFLTKSYEHLTGGRQLTSIQDRFDDDDGSIHRSNIDAVAGAGFASGTGVRMYAPGRAITRAQLASFLVRVLDLRVQQGQATAPDQR